MQPWPLTFYAIHLGHSDTQLDPGEGNTTAENADKILNDTYGTADAPLYDRIIRVPEGDYVPPTDILNQSTPQGFSDNFWADLNGDGSIGAGEGQPFEAVVTYNVTLTSAAGSTATLVVPIVQT